MRTSIPRTSDNRTVSEDDSDTITRLPRLSYSEQAELRTKHRAIALADQRIAELGQQWMAAEATYKAHPTDANYDAMIAAMQRYHAAHDSERCVEDYLATERKVIASARAREAREVCQALARVTCRAPRRQRQRQHRSHRTAARATVRGDSGDDPPEPPGSRPRLSSEVRP